MLMLFLRRLYRLRLYSFFCVVITSVNLLCVHGAHAVEFTQSEKDYISDHPAIRVYTEDSWYPFNFIKHGEVSGYSNALIRLVAEKVGLRIEFVTGYSWQESLDKLKNNEIDVITNIVSTPEREAYALYTHYHGLTVIDGLLVSADKLVQPNLSNIKSIAIVAGSIYQKKVASQHPHIHIVPTQGLDDSIEQFKKGHVEAVLDSYDALNYYLHRSPMSNIKNEPIYNGELARVSPMLMAVPKQNKLLRDILDKGLLQISNKDIFTLRKEWGITNQADIWIQHHATNARGHVIFNKQQSQYLEVHPQLRMCVIADMMPLSQVVDGEYIGISADFMDLFHEHIKNQLVVVGVDSIEAAFLKLQQDECDFIPALNSTQFSEKPVYFTFPYLRFPSVIITVQSNPSYNLKQLLYKPLGALKNKVYQDNFKSIYKNKTLKQYDTIADGFRAVGDKEIYGFIGALPMVAQRIQDGHLPFKIVDQFEIEYTYSLAVKKGNLVLLSIFNKLLAAIDKQDKQLILNRWSPVIKERHQNTIGYMMTITFFFLLCVFLLVSLFLLIQSNRQLQAKKNKLEASSIYDDLTGLPNRLYFQTALEKEWFRSDLHKETVSLIMIDIDHFKAFNEDHGRQVGDQCLIELASCLQKVIKRPTDLLARWGGEEFIALLPHSTETDINAISGVIFTVLHHWSVKFPRLGTKDHLSVSIGAASMQVNASHYSEKELIRRASRALYRAQDAGYNQMVIYKQEI